MKERYYGTSKWVLALLMGCVTSFLVHIDDNNVLLRRVPSVFFCCVIAAWTYTVSERILHRRIRFYLVLGGIALASLFALRESRWVFFEDSITINNLLIYAYYIPIFVVTVCILGVSLCIDRPEEIKNDRFARAFWVVAALLSVILLSNDSHHMFMLINDAGKINHRLLYYLIVIYEIVLVCISFFIIMKRCSLSAVKKRWYVPVSAACVGVLLLIVYFISGGSPSIGGEKLFYIQEVYALLFIGFLEGCIQIGLIPANHEYADFFEKADVEAWIEDEDHTLIYETGKNREKTPLSEDRKVQLKEMPIHGGSVHWVQDLTHVYELRDEISAAIDRLSEENTLIQYENEIKSRNAEISARRRLYEKIAGVTQPQTEKLKEYIRLAETDKENERKWIAIGTVICACIKRRANLELMGYEKDFIPSQELYISINEVNDCLKKCGYNALAWTIDEEELPAAVVGQRFSEFEQAVMQLLTDGR